MAYGNWGGNVFKNGERMREWEDATPYRETEMQAGYWQDEGTDPHHAVLGCQRVRLCGYKDSPMLYLDGASVDLTKFSPDPEDPEYSADEGEGEIEGYRFGWSIDDSPAKVSLWLIEPDGVEWEGFSGYCMGAGWED